MASLPMLGALGQQQYGMEQSPEDQKRLALANQLMKGATSPQQNQSWAGTAAQALSGALGGYEKAQASGQMMPIQKAYYGLTTTGWY